MRGGKRTVYLAGGIFVGLLISLVWRWSGGIEDKVTPRLAGEGHSRQITESAPATPLRPSSTFADGLNDNSQIKKILGDPPPATDTLSSADIAAYRQVFEEQRDRWVAVHTVAASFRNDVAYIRNGEVVDWKVPSITGRLELLMKPTGDPKLPINMLGHLYDSENKWHFILNGGKQPADSWSDNPASPVKDSARIHKVFGMFPYGEINLPVKFMSSLYRDSKGGPASSRRTMDEFFSSQLWVPRRVSSPEESKERFGGETLYMHLFEGDAPRMQIWTSAENGEFRRIEHIVQPGLAMELLKGGDVTVSFSYENYIRQGNAHFPRRFVKTWSQGVGQKREGWIQTIELSDVKLNKGVTEEGFRAPS